MANKGLVIPSKLSAASNDAWVRSAKASADIDNGRVVALTALTGVAGEGEVWTAGTPATGATLTHLWMVTEPEIVVTDSKFKNLDPNPLNFTNLSGKVFTVCKLQIGDLVMLNAEALAGTKSTNEYVVATNATTALTWAAAAVSGVSLHLVATEYVSIPTGTSLQDQQRVTMYKFECVAVA